MDEDATVFGLFFYYYILQHDFPSKSIFSPLPGGNFRIKNKDTIIVRYVCWCFYLKKRLYQVSFFMGSRHLPTIFYKEVSRLAPSLLVEKYRKRGAAAAAPAIATTEGRFFVCLAWDREGCARTYIRRLYYL